jgi:hypothetical protein
MKLKDLELTVVFEYCEAIETYSRINLKTAEVVCFVCRRKLQHLVPTATPLHKCGRSHAQGPAKNKKYTRNECSFNLCFRQYLPHGNV